MKIGVNALYLRPGKVGGSEVYLRHLATHLLEGGHQLVLFATEEASSTLSFGGAARVIVPARGGFSQVRRLLTENTVIAGLVRTAEVEVLLNPANFGPLARMPIPQVAIMHDLQHVTLPKNFSVATRLARSLLFRATMARSCKVIAISEFTRKDLIRRYQADPSKVITIHPGAESFEPPDLQARKRVQALYQLPARFLFYPAMLAPHKNHDILLRALREPEAKDARLVFTGAASGRADWLTKRITQLGLRGRVTYLGFVPRGDVLPIMACSDALVFPSLFEGFGLPVLEAMRCDVPVLASTATSLPEVCQDAALLLDPDSPTAWAIAMNKIMSFSEPRETLVRRGRARVLAFSWSRCANETEAVFRSCM